MSMEPAGALLALASGGLVGATLGLIGGGGSILATPLLVYVVGVGAPHLAIGTGAAAVAANALAGLFAHARRGPVKWRCAVVFAAAGALGAAAGSALGKATDGARLLSLFGLLMIAIGLVSSRRKASEGDADIRLSSLTAGRLLPRLVGFGLGVGALSGFFGIGGGFLIVPGLMAATGMPMANAVSASLVAVAVFGFTTAASYAAAGLVDWPTAALFIAGGAAGAPLGMRLSLRLAARKRALALVFSGVVIAVGLFIVARGLRGP